MVFTGGVAAVAAVGLKPGEDEGGFERKTGGPQGVPPRLLPLHIMRWCLPLAGVQDALQHGTVLTLFNGFNTAALCVVLCVGTVLSDAASILI